MWRVPVSLNPTELNGGIGTKKRGKVSSQVECLYLITTRVAVLQAVVFSIRSCDAATPGASQEIVRRLG